MVHYQQLNVAGIAGTQLGAFPDDTVGKPLHVDVVSATFPPSARVNRNVKAALHKLFNPFVHNSTLCLMPNIS
jgi:hypothetical protein